MADDLTDRFTRHAVLVEGLKVNEAQKVVRLHNKLLDRVISKAANTEWQGMRRQALAEFIAGANQTLTDPRLAKTAMKLSLSLAQYEAKFSADTIDDFIGQPEDFQMQLPSTGQIETAAKTKMLSMAGPDGGKLLAPFYDDHIKGNARLISGAMKQGFALGETTGQIVSRIRAQRKTSRRSLMAIVRTGMTHAATAARAALAARNSDIIGKERIVATLDGRTSSHCRALDGREFPIGKGPRPPFHINCRTTVVPVLKGKLAKLQQSGKRMSRDPKTGKGKLVPSSESYYDWLKRQPRKFQKQVLGPGRAKLFRSKGMTIERFRQLELDRKFRPRTLAQIQAIESRARNA